MYSYWELAIIAFILIGIGFVLWRGGSANPIGTGKLQHSVRNLRQEIGTMGRDLKTLKDQSAHSTEQLDRKISDEKRRLDGFGDRIEGIERRVDGIHNVLSAMSESVRSLSIDFKDHRTSVDARLQVLASMDERIANNSRTIAAAGEQIVLMDARLDRIGEVVASTSVQCGATGRQVDRLYDFLTQKALDK